MAARSFAAAKEWVEARVANAAMTAAIVFVFMTRINTWSRAAAQDHLTGVRPDCCWRRTRGATRERPEFRGPAYVLHHEVSLPVRTSIEGETAILSEWTESGVVLSDDGGCSAIGVQPGPALIRPSATFSRSRGRRR